jgi:hypothetical protein
LQEDAKRKGLDKMMMDEINAEIASYRREKRLKQKGRENVKSRNRSGKTKKKRPEFKTRIVRGRYPDRQFDIDFWQEQGAEAIFAAAWEMICFTEKFKHGKKPTFQRTFTKVIRNKEASGRKSDAEHLKLLRKKSKKSLKLLENRDEPC